MLFVGFGMAITSFAMFIAAMINSVGTAQTGRIHLNSFLLVALLLKCKFSRLCLCVGGLCLPDDPVIGQRHLGGHAVDKHCGRLGNCSSMDPHLLPAFQHGQGLLGHRRQGASLLDFLFCSACWVPMYVFVRLARR